MIIHSFRWVTLRVCVTRRETDMLSKWLICCFKDHMLTSVPFRLPLHLVSSPSSTSIIPSSLSPTRSPFPLLFPSLVPYSFPLSLFYPFSHFKFLPCPLLLHLAHIPTRQLNPNVPSLFWLSQLSSLSMSSSNVRPLTSFWTFSNDSSMLPSQSLTSAV